jgi:hypothetical protein
MYSEPYTITHQFIKWLHTLFSFILRAGNLYNENMYFTVLFLTYTFTLRYNNFEISFSFRFSFSFRAENEDAMFSLLLFYV